MALTLSEVLSGADDNAAAMDQTISDLADQLVEIAEEEAVYQSVLEDAYTDMNTELLTYGNWIFRHTNHYSGTGVGTYSPPDDNSNLEDWQVYDLITGTFTAGARDEYGGLPTATHLTDKVCRTTGAIGDFTVSQSYKFRKPTPVHPIPTGTLTEKIPWYNLSLVSGDIDLSFNSKTHVPPGSVISKVNDFIFQFVPEITSGVAIGDKIFFTTSAPYVFGTVIGMANDAGATNVWMWMHQGVVPASITMRTDNTGTSNIDLDSTSQDIVTGDTLYISDGINRDMNYGTATVVSGCTGGAGGTITMSCAIPNHCMRIGKLVSTDAALSFAMTEGDIPADTNAVMRLVYQKDDVGWDSNAEVLELIDAFDFTHDYIWAPMTPATSYGTKGKAAAAGNAQTVVTARKSKYAATRTKLERFE